MSRRWTLSEDTVLAKYFDAMGDLVGVNDLGRPKGAAANRVKALKACGAWQPLRALLAAEYDHLHAYFTALGQDDEASWLTDIHPGSHDRTTDVPRGD